MKQDEDFAQWLAIKTLEGKSLKQTIGQAHIDYLRETYLDRHELGVKLGPLKKSYKAENGEYSFERFIAENPWLDKLPERIRVIICLLSLGFRQREIAYILGVREATISDALARISKDYLPRLK